MNSNATVPPRTSREPEMSRVFEAMIADGYDYPIERIDGAVPTELQGDGGKPRVIECEPFFYSHFANAFEEGSDTVADLSHHVPYGFHGTFTERVAV